MVNLPEHAWATLIDAALLVDALERLRAWVCALAALRWAGAPNCHSSVMVAEHVAGHTVMVEVGIIDRSSVGSVLFLFPLPWSWHGGSSLLP